MRYLIQIRFQSTFAKVTDKFDIEEKCKAKSMAIAWIKTVVDDTVYLAQVYDTVTKKATVIHQAS